MTTHLIITGVLKARTAVHIGSGQGNNLTDALIRRNGAGEPIIPGTAIAGSLRAMLTRLAPGLGMEKCNALKTKENGQNDTCTCEVCQLFGNLNPKDEGDKQARASRLYVFDAGLSQTFEVSETSKVSTPTTIRDGVGINRATRTAADAAKFDLEVLPAGSTFNLRLELRGYHRDTRIRGIDRQLLAVALSEWQAGRAWLGGRVARGLGGFQLERLEIVEGNLNEPEQLMAFLQDDPWGETEDTITWLNTHLETARRNVGSAAPPDTPPITRRWIQAEFTLKATGPLAANDTTASVISGFDHAPLMLGLGAWQKPVLTGASLRGVIRSHAEKIARTLATINANGDDTKSSTEKKEEFLKKCPACDPLVSRKPNEGGKPLESCDSLLKYADDEIKAYIREHDDVKDEHLCLACHLFGSARRGSRLIVEDAHFIGENPNYKILDFLAIDRFTGGGAEHFKFDALVLWQPRFKVRLYLENPQVWELGWLALTLRDMADGWLRVGLGAAKGLGQVEIDKDSVNLRMGFLGQDELASKLALPDSNEKHSGIYQVAEYNAGNQTIWLDQAKGWVGTFNATIRTTETKRPIDLPDTYFGEAGRLYKILSPE